MIIKKNIYVMYTIALLQGMVFYAPIATLYRQNVGLDIFSITLIESISLVVMIALEIPWGMLADRLGYRATMIICSLLFFISKIIFWQATSFFGFLSERLLLSVVISGLSGVDSTILYLSCAKEKSQQVFSIYEQLGTVGMMIASIFYACIVKENYRFAAFLTMLSYGIAAILALMLEDVKVVKEQEERPKCEMIQAIGRLFHQKKWLLFLIGIALVNETHQTITVFLNQLKYIQCGLSSQMIGLIYIGMIFVGLIGCFSMQVTEKIGIKKTLLALILIVFCSCLCLGITNQAWISVGAVLLIHIAHELLSPLQKKIQNMEVTSQQRATELSVNAVIMDALAVMTNLVFGKVANLSLSNAFLLGACFCFIGYLFCGYYLKHTSL